MLIIEEENKKREENQEKGGKQQQKRSLRRRSSRGTEGVLQRLRRWEQPHLRSASMSRRMLYELLSLPIRITHVYLPSVFLSSSCLPFAWQHSPVLNVSERRSAEDERAEEGERGKCGLEGSGETRGGEGVDESE